jgi:hypothetical protein
LVDCHWNDSHTASYQGRRVAAGDEFAIASGLAEITYDTGAKVLLQGPVTYQVDSPRGGFLSVGKLTACIEKKEVGAQKSNPPLFAIRTPTAVVTDLGIEFGVEVKDNGETRSHVFRGSVQLQQTGVAVGKETSGNTVILHANEAASVKIQSSGKHNKNKQSGVTTNTKEAELSLSLTEFDATAFVLPDQMRQYAEEQRLKPLRRWQTYSQQLRKDPALVAYYDFQIKDDNCSILPNLSSAGNALDGRVMGGDWVDGRLFGKMALLFHGSGSGDKVMLPHQERFNFTGPFSVAVWFKMTSSAGGIQSLVTKGDDAWRLQYAETLDPKKWLTDVSTWSDNPGTACVSAKAQHVTLSSNGAAAVNVWSVQSYQYGSYSFTIGNVPPNGNTVFGLQSRDGQNAIIFANDIGNDWQFFVKTDKQLSSPRDASGPVTFTPQSGDVFTFVWKKAYAAVYRNGSLVAEKRGDIVPSVALYRNMVNYAGGSASFTDVGPSDKKVSFEIQGQHEHTKTLHQKSPLPDLTDNRWHLAVAVYEPMAKTSHKRLYVDGQRILQGDVMSRLPKNNLPVCLGANGSQTSSFQEFNGVIDEAAIFVRALSTDEIMNMYRAGNPDGEPQN